MGRPNAKKVLVEKIAKEQNLDEKDLWRLPIEELRKMDAVVPDEDGSDLLGSDETSQELPDSKSDELPPAPTPKPVGKVSIGRHPVTGAPVYE